MKNIGDILFYLAVLFGTLLMSIWGLAFIIKFIAVIIK